MSDALAGLVRTMDAFVSGNTPAAVFDETYRAKFTELPTGLDMTTFAVLETLFFACEDYVADPSLRDPGDPDEEALLEAARTALTALAGRS